MDGILIGVKEAFRDLMSPDGCGCGRHAAVVGYAEFSRRNFLSLKVACSEVRRSPQEGVL